MLKGNYQVILCDLRVIMCALNSCRCRSFVGQMIISSCLPSNNEPLYTKEFHFQVKIYLFFLKKCQAKLTRLLNYLIR